MWRCRHFFFFFFACQKGLSCRIGTPTLCLKNWATNFESEKKKSVVVPPPPPPPPLIQLFLGTCATFGAGGGPGKKIVCPPHNPLRICAHVCDMFLIDILLKCSTVVYVDDLNELYWNKYEEKKIANWYVNNYKWGKFYYKRYAITLACLIVEM